MDENAEIKIQKEIIREKNRLEKLENKKGRKKENKRSNIYWKNTIRKIRKKRDFNS